MAVVAGRAVPAMALIFVIVLVLVLVLPVSGHVSLRSCDPRKQRPHCSGAHESPWNKVSNNPSSYWKVKV